MYVPPATDSLVKRLIPSLFGRLRRSDYWVAYAAWSLITLLPMAIFFAYAVTHPGTMEESTANLIQAGLHGLLAVMLIVNFNYSVRRLHDLGKSGWLSLLLLVPLVNIFIGIWLAFGKSQPQANKYGEVPKKIVGTAAAVAIAAAAGVAVGAFNVWADRVDPSAPTAHVSVRFEGDCSRRDYAFVKKELTADGKGLAVSGSGTFEGMIAAGAAETYDDGSPDSWTMSGMTQGCGFFVTKLTK